MTDSAGPGDDQGEVREPENSTVDDWIGQRVDRDTERAERLLEETENAEEAEEVWDAEAEKRRPEDMPTEDRPVHGGDR